MRKKYQLALTYSEMEILEDALCIRLVSAHTVDPHPMGPTIDPDKSPTGRRTKSLLRRIMRARGAPGKEIEDCLQHVCTQHY